MKVTQISENPVLVGGDYKRACLFFDEVVPLMWPSGESESEAKTNLNSYGEFRDALEAPFLKEMLLRSRWRGYIEAYAHASVARFVFLKMRRDHPEATDLWQLADMTVNYLKHEMPGLDQQLISILFPDVQTSAARLVSDPIKQMIESLEQKKISFDTYGHSGIEDTEDSVDVMLSNIDLVRCDNLT